MSDWPTSLFTGLFTRFGPTPARPHDPAFALCAGLAASWLPHHEISSASGIGADQAAADGACVGEAIERLQAGPLPSDAFVTARYGDWPLSEPAVDPARWVLFHADQYAAVGFPFTPLTTETECAWVCCRQAITGEPWWVPAELAYLHQPAGHHFCPGYSTGLACGRTGHPMLLRGLQEVIERDAVVGGWWGRYPLEEHTCADVTALLGDDIRVHCLRPNLTYRCIRVVTPFSDHVTMVTLEGEDREGYVFSIGSACRETRRASWEKSLLEAIHGRHYARYLKSQIASDVMTMAPTPTSFAEHAVYHSMHPTRIEATALGQSLKRERSEESEASLTLQPLTNLIERLGPERPVLFRSMTPVGLAAENLDWHVLRVIVPGLQPLHGHHSYPHLGGPLWSPRGLADWRAMPPHPFP